MLTITIEHVAPFDGVFPLDTEVSFNGRELHLIKNVAGVRLGEINEALAAGDYDLVIAFAVIALTRNGRIQPQQAAKTAELLLEAETGHIMVEDTGAGDDGPPSEAPNGAAETTEPAAT